MFITMKSRSDLKPRHIWSKPRSPEKPCGLSRRQNFDRVFMKLNQNVYLHELYVRNETKSSLPETMSGQI